MHQCHNRDVRAVLWIYILPIQLSVTDLNQEARWKLSPFILTATHLVYVYTLLRGTIQLFSYCLTLKRTAVSLYVCRNASPHLLAWLL